MRLDDFNVSSIKTANYSGTPLIRSPRGQKNFGRINEGFFYKKIYDGFC